MGSQSKRGPNITTKKGLLNQVIGLQNEHTVDKARIRELEDALRKIKDTQGKVCKDYQICQHTSCSSSYSSWAIADNALSEKSDKEKNDAGK